MRGSRRAALFGIVVIAFVAGCTDKENSTTDGAATSTENSRVAVAQMVNTAFEAIREGDAKTACSLLTPKAREYLERDDLKYEYPSAIPRGGGCNSVVSKLSAQIEMDEDSPYLDEVTPNEMFFDTNHYGEVCAGRTGRLPVVLLNGPNEGWRMASIGFAATDMPGPCG
jgi:hypothetical protein